MKEVEKLKRKLKQANYKVREFKKGARTEGQINSAKSISKKLRKKATPSELVVIDKLKEERFKVEFQYPIYLDNSYIVVDIYLPQIKTVVEVDGGYHTQENISEADKWRDIKLRNKKYKVYRITNNRASEISSRMLAYEVSKAK